MRNDPRYGTSEVKTYLYKDMYDQPNWRLSEYLKKDIVELFDTANWTSKRKTNHKIGLEYDKSAEVKIEVYDTVSGEYAGLTIRFEKSKITCTDNID